MNSKIALSGMTIAAIAIFFASGHIGNQPAIAFGGYGHFGHGFGGYGHFGPGIGHYYYGPGYVMDNPCGGGPYSIINGQIVCTTS
jgi:hypothetical protein